MRWIKPFPTYRIAPALQRKDEQFRPGLPLGADCGLVSDAQPASMRSI